MRDFNRAVMNIITCFHLVICISGENVDRFLSWELTINLTAIIHRSVFQIYKTFSVFEGEITSLSSYDLGLDHNVNNFLNFLRLSIVIWPHATSSSIETVCAKWRILACITIILNMDMAMPKRWATHSIGCTSNSLLWLLLSFLFLTCKWTAVVFLPRAAYQWSGQRQRFSLAMLQPFPAKVMCMYFFRSKCKTFLFFSSERMIFSRQTTRKKH